MRGRLINPFLAELARLDTAGTAADPDGAGPLDSGYDDDFREVSRNAVTGASYRAELPAILIPCQVEVSTFDQLQQLSSGNAPNARISLVFHFADLERLGLVDGTTGEPLIRNNDRLVSIRKCIDESLVQSIDALRGGLYITEVQPQSFGLSGGERNLLIATFEEREQGFRGGA